MKKLATVTAALALSLGLSAGVASATTVHGTSATYGTSAGATLHGTSVTPDTKCRFPC